MQKIADLHTHTNSSDGVLSPSELLSKAIGLKISHISITDHDNVDGYLNAIESNFKDQIKILPGIELSCFENEKEYHLLGYGFDVENKALKKHILKLRQAREERARNMRDKLANLGVNINFDDILEIAGDAPITRPHIAKAITSAGYTENSYEAFTKYIGDGAPAYEPKINFPVSEGIKLLHNAGGIAVIAHPANNIDEGTLHSFIKNGLDGIEVFHPMHNNPTRSYYKSIAKKYNLLQTGGSDFHGNRPADEQNFGKEVVTAETYEKILDRCKNYRQKRFLFF